MRKPTKPNPETKLLSRVWSSIENLPSAHQNQARDLIRKIEKYPNLTINRRFEMVYKDVPQHGTSIIQLLLNHVSADRREILPGLKTCLKTSPLSTKDCYFHRLKSLKTFNSDVQRQENRMSDGD